MVEDLLEKGVQGRYWKNTQSQYVIFSLAGEEYGIHILSVQEIIGIPHFTRLPNTPPFIKGVINLRGTIIPVLDLRARFQLPTAEMTKHNVIIIVMTQHEGRSKTIGLFVDDVDDVLPLSEENLQDVPLFSSNIDSRFIEHLAMLDERLIILLNVNLLLDDDELEELEKFTS